MIALDEQQSAIVRNMVEKNKSYTQIVQAMVALDYAEKPADAIEYLASIGVTKDSRKTLTNRMYAYFEAAPRTQVEFYTWLRENGTENAWKMRKVHDKVRALTVRIHTTLSGVQFQEELYQEAA